MDETLPHRRSLPARVVWVALAVAACGSPSEQGKAPERPPLVEAVAARIGSLPLEETVNGVVRAENQVAIRSEISAPIVEVMVRSGEAVEQGQPLVRLRDDELRERLRQAEADLRLAEAAAAEARARVAELEVRVGRTRTLAEGQLVSVQDLDTQEAQLTALRASAEQALARVDQAAATADERRFALTRTVVRSPLTGRVGQRRAEVGMQADTGTVLFVVGNLDRVMVEVPLTEGMLEKVRPGLAVSLETQAEDSEPIRASMSRISPFLAEESFTTVGEIDIDNREGRLWPGMFVTVRILYGASERATLIPESAVWEDPESGERGVWVVEDTEGLTPPPAASSDATEVPRDLVFRVVEVVAEGGGGAGVEGVDEGEWVVVVGQHMLGEQASDERPGDRVSARSRVRAAAWERVLELQSLQREDLLAGFLEKQQTIAAALGAEIPESEDEVDRVLAAESGSNGGGD